MPGTTETAVHTKGWVHHDVPVWHVDKEGECVGINRWSDIEQRKRNETEAKAGDELPAENKGDASSRVQASEEPA